MEASKSPPSPDMTSSPLTNLKPSIAIIILILSTTFIVSVAICLLLRHLNRHCIRHLSDTATASSSSRRISPEEQPPPSLAASASFFDSLPLFTFSSITTRRSFNGGDCAVCLSKFDAQDQLRLLPVCCHAFHVTCIDTWLQNSQTCPLCRSSLFASDVDILSKASSNNNINNERVGSNSFRLQIGSLSRRRSSTDFGEPRVSSYSVGSFDYIVEEESEVAVNQTHRRNVSEKEESGVDVTAAERSLAEDVGGGGGGRSWLQDYVDRLSSFSSRALSFRGSGRFFTGSSRRSDVEGGDQYEAEANRVGEEISEMFGWLSGV